MTRVYASYAGFVQRRSRCRMCGVIYDYFAKRGEFKTYICSDKCAEQEAAKDVELARNPPLSAFEIFLRSGPKGTF